MSVKNKEYPLVLVIWEDIVATDASWREADDAIDWVDTEDSLAHQCGFLLEEDEKYVVIMDSFFRDGATVGAITRIPREVVRFIKKISIDKFKEI